jgi:sec-independent protein translocase protein TatB
MFDFAWSEFGVIAVVALIAIGPKDMPVAIRAVTSWIKKARRMAAEFQTHVDEMVREADLGEVRDQLNQIRNFDVKSMVENTVDPDGSLRGTFASNPLDTNYAATVEAQPATEATVAELERPDQVETEGAPMIAAETGAPAFIPPSAAPAAADRIEREAPAFIPPAVAEQYRAPH